MGFLYDLQRSNTLCKSVQSNLNVLQSSMDVLWIELKSGEILMIDSPVKTIWTAKGVGVKDKDSRQ